MRNLPGWLFILGVAAFVSATALCSAVAFVTARQIAVDTGRITDGEPISLQFDLFVRAQPTATRTPAPAPTGTPVADTGTSDAVPDTAADRATEMPPPPDDSAAVPDAVDVAAQYLSQIDPATKTILLLGIDQRSAVDTEKAYRSDTIMLVNIDPIRKHVGVVGIPRDLFVRIPGYTNNDRINQANYFGDLNNFPGGGGPALAAETIRANFGIRVDNYVRINFDVFEAVVDTFAPNGVEICVSEAIYDPKYPDAGYGTIEVRFEPGCQRLNAERLLQYARTRATPGGDFDRARRQQEVLRAAQAQLLTFDNIPNLIAQAQMAYSRIADNVKTDLSLDEIITLALFARELSPDDMTFETIDSRHIIGFDKNVRGDDVVLPDWGRIRDLLYRTFNPEPDLTLADLRQRAEAERARIVVYNNTDIAGLAGNTRDWLASRQVRVENTVGNIPQPTNSDTVIRDYTGKPWTARYLAALMNLPEDRILPGGDGLTSADVMVVAGADVQPLLTSGTP